MKIKTLREYRRNAGLGQCDLGYDQSYISRIESGDREPPQHVAKEMSGLYRISIRVFWQSWELSKEQNQP